MNLILTDTSLTRTNLLPFTFTRPVADIRAGILTIRRKWEHDLGIESSSSITEAYLSGKFPLVAASENLVINGSILPSPELVDLISSIPAGSVCFSGELFIAARIGQTAIDRFKAGDYSEFPVIRTEIKPSAIEQPWQIFSRCGEEITADFRRITTGRKSAPVSATNRIIGDPSMVFAEAGAVIEGAYLNTTGGCIYIGKDAEVMEGSMIRGPFSLGDHSQVKLGAKIYGPTSFGPHCKVGGEVSNSVIFGYSNKGHDGFLGNSVLGEWCNIGADTNTSNLKNNYAEVKLWNYGKGSFVKTGLQFCGLMMGDHSKCGINTMFNTGTVVGVSANIFGAGFPRNFIPSFSWGGAAGMATYAAETAIETAERVYERRKMTFDAAEAAIFHAIFETTARNRNF